MIVILKDEIQPDSAEFDTVIAHLAAKPNIQTRVHRVRGAAQTLTEIYLIGDTQALSLEEIGDIPGVERVVRVSHEYRILGRHGDYQRRSGFEYQGLRFDQENLHLFAGLCAVDNREHTEIMMRALQKHGLQCTRMGAYKPRTNPYSFQGHGAACLPYVFELAGKYGIRVIAMEVTHETHIEEIEKALEGAGHPTGVMLQIGTRNTQNFELLKAVGRHAHFPALLKRGFGITLEESLNAAEYLASEGNDQVIFCLRGVKTNLGDPHRNLVDFTHVPVVKRLTRMPVCIDPSHSVGKRDADPDGLLDLFHATAQGIVAGANMILVDFHPDPPTALVDGPQALTMAELPLYLQDIELVRETYQRRRALLRAAS